MCANQHQRISIIVHKGQNWEGNFILKKNQMFQSAAQKNVLRIEGVASEKTSETETTLKIELNNYSDASRVHIFAQQFSCNQSSTLRDTLEDAIASKIALTKFPFAKWKNMYESDQAIGDEIRYVFDRQKQASKMGNTLDRPSLLMKRNFVRNTDTVEEVLKVGTQYAKHDLGDVGRNEEQLAVHSRRRQATLSSYAAGTDGTANAFKDL